VSINKPKVFGGLGILNTLLMNQCLISKWIWKIEKGSNELCYKILQAKYMWKKGVFSTPEIRDHPYSGKVYIKSTCFSGGLNTLLKKGIELDSGRTHDWAICHLGFSVTTFMLFAKNRTLWLGICGLRGIGISLSGDLYMEI
jgi:hypothetical protein